MVKNMLNKKRKPKKKLPDIWEVAARQGKKIKHLRYREFNLTGGEHYWVIDDPRKLTVKCISCPVEHGGIIDARDAVHTKVKDGIIYYKGKPITKKPKGFKPSSL